MSPRSEVRSFDYVNHPYESVHGALATDPARVFRAATRAATSRVRSLASELRVSVAGLEVGAPIEVEVGDVEQAPREAPGGALTRIPIRWQAATRPGLFPLMSAELSIYPLTSTETQLDFLGRYDPPLGALGEAVDALVGRRIAEASVHRFVADVAAYLRRSLGEEGVGA
jgi:hypothetical protein